jgi:ribosome-associated translation inhibitor RaiA
MIGRLRRRRINKVLYGPPARMERFPPEYSRIDHSIDVRRSMTDTMTRRGKPVAEVPQESNLIAERLHLATGFAESERDWIVRRLASLGPRLRSFDEVQVDLEISLKDRDEAGQQVTLECWIRRTPRLHLVSTSDAQELAVALNEVRNSLLRQIDDAKTRTEPRSNRALRHPEAAAEL